jgi:hypothetical protein
MMAEETNGTVGARAMQGGDDVGTTGARERLASLLGEEMPDLIAATCLPRSTLYRVLHTSDEPRPATLQALDDGMRLLESENLCGIVGWRNAPREWLAERFHISVAELSILRKGKRQWRVEERERLPMAMAEWRALQGSIDGRT